MPYYAMILRPIGLSWNLLWTWSKPRLNPVSLQSEGGCKREVERNKLTVGRERLMDRECVKDGLMKPIIKLASEILSTQLVSSH
jgi:hypothetical protein